MNGDSEVMLTELALDGLAELFMENLATDARHRRG